MMRLILPLLFLTLLALAVASLVALLRQSRAQAALPVRQEDRMPATFRTIAYILLLAVMTGTATGWLGAN